MLDAKDVAWAFIGGFAIVFGIVAVFMVAGFLIVALSWLPPFWQVAIPAGVLIVLVAMLFLVQKEEA